MNHASPDVIHCVAFRCESSADIFRLAQTCRAAAFALSQRFWHAYYARGLRFDWARSRFPRPKWNQSRATDVSKGSNWAHDSRMGTYQVCGLTTPLEPGTWSTQRRMIGIRAMESARRWHRDNCVCGAEEPLTVPAYDREPGDESCVEVLPDGSYAFHLQDCTPFEADVDYRALALEDHHMSQLWSLWRRIIAIPYPSYAMESLCACACALANVWYGDERNHVGQGAPLPVASDVGNAAAAGAPVLVPGGVPDQPVPFPTTLDAYEAYICVHAGGGTQGEWLDAFEVAVPLEDAAEVHGVTSWMEQPMAAMAACEAAPHGWFLDVELTIEMAHRWGFLALLRLFAELVLHRGVPFPRHDDVHCFDTAWPNGVPVAGTQFHALYPYLRSIGQGWGRHPEHGAGEGIRSLGADPVFTPFGAVEPLSDVSEHVVCVLLAFSTAQLLDMVDTIGQRWPVVHRVYSVASSCTLSERVYPFCNGIAEVLGTNQCASGFDPKRNDGIVPDMVIDHARAPPMDAGTAGSTDVPMTDAPASGSQSTGASGPGEAGAAKGTNGTPLYLSEHVDVTAHHALMDPHLPEDVQGEVWDGVLRLMRRGGIRWAMPTLRPVALVLLQSYVARVLQMALLLAQGDPTARQCASGPLGVDTCTESSVPAIRLSHVVQGIRLAHGTTLLAADDDDRDSDDVTDAFRSYASARAFSDDEAEGRGVWWLSSEEYESTSEDSYEGDRMVMCASSGSSTGSPVASSSPPDPTTWQHAVTLEHCHVADEVEAHAALKRVRSGDTDAMVAVPSVTEARDAHWMPRVHGSGDVGDVERSSATCDSVALTLEAFLVRHTKWAGDPDATVVPFATIDSEEESEAEGDEESTSVSPSDVDHVIGGVNDVTLTEEAEGVSGPMGPWLAEDAMEYSPQCLRRLQAEGQPLPPSEPLTPKEMARRSMDATLKQWWSFMGEDDSAVSTEEDEDDDDDHCDADIGCPDGVDCFGMLPERVLLHCLMFCRDVADALHLAAVTRAVYTRIAPRQDVWLQVFRCHFGFGCVMRWPQGVLFACGHTASSERPDDCERAAAAVSLGAQAANELDVLPWQLAMDNAGDGEPLLPLLLQQAVAGDNARAVCPLCCPGGRLAASHAARARNWRVACGDAGCSRALARQCHTGATVDTHATAPVLASAAAPNVYLAEPWIPLYVYVDDPHWRSRRRDHAERLLCHGMHGLLQPQVARAQLSSLAVHGNAALDQVVPFFDPRFALHGRCALQDGWGRPAVMESSAQPLAVDDAASLASLASADATCYHTALVGARPRTGSLVGYVARLWMTPLLAYVHNPAMDADPVHDTGDQAYAEEASAVAVVSRRRNSGYVFRYDGCARGLASAARVTVLEAPRSHLPSVCFRVPQGSVDGRTWCVDYMGNAVAHVLWPASHPEPRYMPLAAGTWRLCPYMGADCVQGHMLWCTRKGQPVVEPHHALRWACITGTSADVAPPPEPMVTVSWCYAHHGRRNWATAFGDDERGQRIGDNFSCFEDASVLIGPKFDAEAFVEVVPESDFLVVRQRNAVGDDEVVAVVLPALFRGLGVHMLATETHLTVNGHDVNVQDLT